MPALHLPHMAPMVPMVAAGAGPRINPRTGRGVSANAPDHAARSARAPGMYVAPSVVPVAPVALPTVPARRLGTVPKLAHGHQGSGLGQPVTAGFQSPLVALWTPLENGPDTRAQFTPDRPIPRVTPVGPGVSVLGAQLRPTYNAHDFAPAQRFFQMFRSSMPWAQSSFGPRFRPLTPSQQAALLKRGNTVRRQIPAAQVNPMPYTAGYPTRAAVAARIGGGPIAVLGGNSQ